MNHEFLEAQIKEAKDCIKYYTRKAVVAKAMMHVEGCDIDYERHQIQLYESRLTDNEYLLDIFFTARVGISRGKLGVEAPACTGNEQFERMFRVQQNTLEQLIVFVPATYAVA